MTVRVCLVCEYPTLHGGERSMLATWVFLRQAGFEPVLLAPPRGPLASEARWRGVRIVPFSAFGPGGRRQPQAELRACFATLLAEHRPDLVHANSLAMGRLAGPVAAEVGLPSLAHLRDILRLSATAVADLNQNTRLVAVSRATRDFHVAAGLDAAKTHVLYNGVDLEKFRPRPSSGYLHRELGLPSGMPLLGTIGQIGLRKGQDTLAKAAALLADNAPEAHFVLVGQRSSQKDESRRFEASLHAAFDTLGGRGHFLGVRDDVNRILNELALLVHPARQEPLGRVLLEAAAAGTPVVATDVGGTREIFPPESSAARLVPPDDAEALAGAIQELLADETTRLRLGQAARRRAEAAFSIEAAAEALLRHYRDLV